MSKRMCLDGKVYRKVTIHPYIPAMVQQVEKWLEKMSQDGWKLEDKKGWIFYFIKCKKHNKKYFMYSGFDSSIGWSYDYYRAKEKYSNSQSALFKQTYQIFEIDPKKIDDDYIQYRMSRNKFYKKHYIKLAFFCITFILLTLIVSFYSPLFWIVSLPFVLDLIYAIVSIIILIRGEKQ